MYIIDFTEKAKEGLEKLSSTPKYLEKVERLIEELKNHPKIGTGHPELLKYRNIETWSRRISEKHRLVYQINEDVITVLVISTYGHYKDK